MKKQTEDIFEPAIPVVPQGWDVLPFDQAVDVVSDKSKRIKQSAYLPSGKLPVIDQGQEFIGGFTDDGDMAFEGELPVILFGDHTRSIKYVDRPFAVGAEGVKILKPSSGFDPKYLYYLLCSLQIPSRGYSRHFQFLRKFHFPRAPEDQQKRIVAEIEKQFSRLDETVANLKRVKANLKRYKAAVLKAAVEGRLVETEAELARRAAQGSANVAGGRTPGATEGRSYETGAQLLQRLLETRRSQWKGKGKYNEPAAPDTADLPELPEGWVWCSGAQFFEWSSGEGLTEKRQRQGPYPVYGGNGISGHHDEYYVEEPTIVVGRVGAHCGNVYVTTLKCWITDNAIYAKSFFADVPLQFLQIVFAQAGLNRIAAGSGQPFVNQRMLNEVSIPLPPIDEQLRILAEVDLRLSLVRETEAQIDANMKRADRLRQSILGRAFSGDLLRHVVSSANATPPHASRSRFRTEDKRSVP